ncbi:MAG: hypothetical protein JNJ54_20935 [Myxococcaceae bacterium]|nr:hypothetical protein [Myxococcaceae bacterium]
MRTSALGLALVASVALAEEPSTRLELQVPFEVTLVGLTWGVRPELLIRPGEAGTVSRVRVAVGVFAGKDQVFLPLSVGYRAVFRQGRLVQPAVGAGLELQHRLVSDLAAVRQFGVYVEGGVGFSVTPRLSFGLMVSLDLMLVGGPGIGLGPRLFAGWRF